MLPLSWHRILLYFNYMKFIFTKEMKKGDVMIKLIASDMDGTLLNGEGNLPKEFFHIFEELKEKNIIFAVASGRQYYNLVDNFQAIKNDILFIAENGTYVMQQGKELYSSFLEPSIVKELIKEGRNTEGAEIVLCGKNAAYLENDKAEFIEEVKKYYARYEIVDNLLDVKDDILKFTLCDFKGAAENSHKIFLPLYKETLQIAVSGHLWLDLVNNDVNKGAAIKSIQEKLNISPEETMVFGDYFNDVEMLQSAYYSYAMENAPDGVKKHARFITKSNLDHGVLHTIKEMAL